MIVKLEKRLWAVVHNRTGAVVLNMNFSGMPAVFWSEKAANMFVENNHGSGGLPGGSPGREVWEVVELDIAGKEGADNES